MEWYHCQPKNIKDKQLLPELGRNIEGFYLSLRDIMAQLNSCFQISSLHNSERINSCCFKTPGL
jgi:hypothetical protein